MFELSFVSLKSMLNDFRLVSLLTSLSSFPQEGAERSEGRDGHGPDDVSLGNYSDHLPLVRDQQSADAVLPHLPHGREANLDTEDVAVRRHRSMKIRIRLFRDT